MDVARRGRDQLTNQLLGVTILVRILTSEVFVRAALIVAYTGRRQRTSGRRESEIIIGNWV